MKHNLIKSRDASGAKNASRAKNCKLLVTICAAADNAYLVTVKPGAMGGVVWGWIQNCTSVKIYLVLN